MTHLQTDGWVGIRLSLSSSLVVRFTCGGSISTGHLFQCLLRCFDMLFPFEVAHVFCTFCNDVYDVCIYCTLCACMHLYASVNTHLTAGVCVEMHMHLYLFVYHNTCARLSKD